MEQNISYFCLRIKPKRLLNRMSRQNIYWIHSDRNKVVLKSFLKYIIVNIDKCKAINLRFDSFSRPPLQIFSTQINPESLSPPYDCRQICYGRVHLFSGIANFMRSPDKVPIIIIITHKFDWNSVTFCASAYLEVAVGWKILLPWFRDLATSSRLLIDLLLVLQ